MQGWNVLIMANTGTDASPTWTAVGGQRGAKLSQETDTMEMTSKSSAGNREYDYGFYSWKVSCDGAYVTGEAGYAALQTAMTTKKKVKIRISEDADGAGAGVAVLKEGFVLVTSTEMDAPYDSEATYSVELQGTGALSVVTGP